MSNSGSQIYQNQLSQMSALQSVLEYQSALGCQSALGGQSGLGCGGLGDMSRNIGVISTSQEMQFAVDKALKGWDK
jgi:hypothetical protein